MRVGGLTGLLAWLVLAGAPAAQEAVAPWALTDAAELPEAALLEVLLAPFDPGPAPNAGNDERALAAAEARILPYRLRAALEGTRRWGPVRMLPTADAQAELRIHGEILTSRPQRLALRITAVDATGRQWIDRTYEGTAGPADYMPETPPPFEPVYESIIADLEAARARLTLSELQRILGVAQLRYAADLAPGVFGDYLARTEDGGFRLRRLPAADDPMLARVQRIEASEALFEDTADQQFRAYYAAVAPTYRALQGSLLEADRLLADYRRQARDRRSRKGLQQRYNQLRELKLHEETLRKQLAAFAFESSPTTVKMEGELVQLTGTLEEQYAEWKSLLRRIFEAEVGLPPEQPPG